MSVITTCLMCSGRLSSAPRIPILKPNLVAIAICLRNGASASPTSSSLVNARAATFNWWFSPPIAPEMVTSRDSGRAHFTVATVWC